MDKTDNEIKYPSDLDIDVYRKMVQTYLSMVIRLCLKKVWF